jgi:hypothetical protein
LVIVAVKAILLPPNETRVGQEFALPLPLLKIQRLRQAAKLESC